MKVSKCINYECTKQNSSQIKQNICQKNSIQYIGAFDESKLK